MKVASSILGQDTYKNQPMNAGVEQQIDVSFSLPSSYSLKSINSFFVFFLSEP